MIGTPEHFRRLFLYILDRAEQNTLHITVGPPVRDAVQLSTVLVDMFPDVLEEVYYHLFERVHLTIDPRQLPDDDIWTTRTEPYPLRPFKWVSCPKPRYPTYSQSASNYLMAQGPRGRREPYLPPPQYMAAAAEATMLLRPKAAPATPAARMRSRSRSTRTSSTRVAEGVRAQADPKEARLERIEKAIQQITQSMLDASNSNNIKMDNNKNKDKIPENTAFGSSASTSLTMEQEHNPEAVAFSEETCKFWKTHACWRGDDCNFLHTKRKMCRSMYARARYKCEYGDKCWWAHSEEEQVDTHELY